MSDPVETTETEVPVEETPVEKDKETPAADQDQESDSDDKKPEEDKKPDPKPAEEPKKNHDTRRWERLMRERAEFKAKADWLEQQMTVKKQETVSGSPARDKFGSDEEYVQALTDYMVEKKLSGVKQELTQHQEQTRTQNDWMSKINQARTDYSDYDAAMEDAQDIPISEHTKEAIQSSDLGGDIAYYLAKNPEEALRINSLSPMAAAREIGRIESYVEYEKTQKTKKPPVSKAPSPIKPVHSQGSGTKSLEDMTPAEYIAYRDKQQAKRR
jgi:hypothetical protein